QALLRPWRDHCFQICVDPTPPRVQVEASEDTRRHRIRFRVAHEIGHGFFFDRSWPTPRRLAPIGRREEEDFCNEFARVLLVPASQVARAEPIAESVFALADRFDVSAEVSARALAAGHPNRLLVALGF